MSQDDSDPLKRQATAKELWSVIFAVLAIFASMFVMTQRPVLGMSMLVILVVAAFFLYFRERRSMTDDQKRAFVSATERLNRMPIMRVINFLPKAILVIAILYIAYSVYSGTGAT